MENIWLISIVALVVGAVIGYLLGRSGGGSGRQAELAEQLEDAKRELESYRSEVTGHFEKTAQLVNGLTQSYKEVHEHLASGAQGLCQPGAIDMALEPAMTRNWKKVQLNLPLPKPRKRKRAAQNRRGTTHLRHRRRKAHCLKPLVSKRRLKTPMQTPRQTLRPTVQQPKRKRALRPPERQTHIAALATIRLCIHTA